MLISTHLQTWRNMAKKNLGIMVVVIIFFIGVVLATGFASNSKTIAPKGPVVEVVSSPLEARTDTSSATASPEATPEKLSVEALACTIIGTSGYEVDLRMKNPTTGAATFTIFPSNRMVEISPGQTKRVDILILNEKGVLNLVADGGEKFEVQIPPCVSRSSSGTSGGVGLADDQITQIDTTTPSATAIPEFPWIGFPVVLVFLLLLFFHKK